MLDNLSTNKMSIPVQSSSTLGSVFLLENVSNVITEDQNSSFDQNIQPNKIDDLKKCRNDFKLRKSVSEHEFKKLEEFHVILFTILFIKYKKTFLYL